MSRRKSSTVKRIIAPDMRFNSSIVSSFINNIMMDGKKALARAIVYKAISILADGVKAPKGTELETFLKALENAQPLVEAKARRVGGATYQVPVEIRAERRQKLAISWIRDSARKRNEKSMEEKLGKELIDAYSGRGGACKKKEDVHKTAEANKAFAHFRF